MFQNLNGEARILQEKKINQALRILRNVEEANVKFDRNDGPKFKKRIDFSHAPSMVNIREIKHQNLVECKRFIDFYGPGSVEFHDYLIVNKIKEDAKMKWLNDLLHFYFVDREKFKEKSELHRMLLIKEEIKETVNKYK